VIILPVGDELFQAGR